MEQRRKIVALHGKHRADVDCAAQLAIELLRALDALVDLAKPALDVGGELFPERRKTHTAAFALK